MMMTLQLTTRAHIINSISPDGTVKEVLAFVSLALVSPKQSTLIQAIERGHLSTWPLCTDANVLKFLPDSQETARGHLNQQRKNTRSTQPCRKRKKNTNGPHICIHHRVPINKGKLQQIIWGDSPPHQAGKALMCSSCMTMTAMSFWQNLSSHAISTKSNAPTRISTSTLHREASSTSFSAWTRKPPTS